jgi:hypothetical protein
LVKVGVRSSFGEEAPPDSLGGRTIRTVALPVVTVSFSIPPLPVLDFDLPLDPPLDPKILVLSPFDG